MANEIVVYINNGILFFSKEKGNYVTWWNMATTKNIILRGTKQIPRDKDVVFSHTSVA